MIIFLRFEAGHVTVLPDPAVVHVGDRVVWEPIVIGYDYQRRTPGQRRSSQPRLLFTIYFEHGHPFRDVFGQRFSRDATFPEEVRPERPVVIEPGAVDVPGEFKYGVRLLEENGAGLLSDDDPLLIVRR